MTEPSGMPPSGKSKSWSLRKLPYSVELEKRSDPVRSPFVGRPEEKAAAAESEARRVLPVGPRKTVEHPHAALGIDREGGSGASRTADGH